MDSLYTGEIPKDYKYASFSNGYITLFNRSSARNEALNYYRVYTNNNGFFYSTGTQYFGNNTTTFTELDVSDNWLYRTDIDKIFIVCFIMFFMFIFVFNIATSIFKKGGVFGGLF